MRNKIMLLPFLLLFSLTNYINSRGQYSEKYFYDTEQKGGGESRLIYNYIKSGAYIYIGGRSFDTKKFAPSILKVDTIGTIIWHTPYSNCDTYPDYSYYISNLLLSGNYIYAVCRYDKVGSYHKSEIWKVDENTGEFIWRKPFDYNSTFSIYANQIIDYDTSRLLIGVCKTEHYQKRIIFYDKTTGDTLSSQSCFKETFSSLWVINVDSEKNIYYTGNDSLYKISGSNTDSIIWAINYVNLNIKDILKIYIDQNDSIYLFGTKVSGTHQGKIIALSKKNGMALWNTTIQTNTQDVNLAEVKDVGGNFFVTWAHSLVGGGDFDCYISKISKNNGTLQWNTRYSFIGSGNPGTTLSDEQAGLSLDLDSEGSVYVTGYYGGIGYNNGCWGNLKLDGTNGQVQSESTITTDSLDKDKLSVGWGCCVINDQPYFLGELQYNSSQGAYIEKKITFIKMDPELSKILISKTLGGNVQFPSQTIKILKYGENNTLILKQVGRQAMIEMYNYYNSLIWEKSLLKAYMFLPSDITISKQKKIIVTGQSIDANSIYPYYHSSTKDSIQVFIIDSTGNLLNSYSFRIGYTYDGADDASQNEVFVDDDESIYVFYQKNGAKYYRRIRESIISDEYLLTGILNTKDPYKIKHVSNRNQSELMYFGLTNVANAVYTINKETMTLVPKKYLPSVEKVNNVVNKDLENVLIAGQSSDNHDILLLYNTTALDTVWLRNYPTGTSMMKFIFNEDSSCVYTAGTKKTGVIIKKINMTSGKEMWSYIFRSPADIQDMPLDIEHDKYRNHLIITGYYKDLIDGDTVKNIFIETIDTSGSHISSILKQGTNGDNYALCVQSLDNGIVWVGGNINNFFGNAGFIYEIDTALLCYGTVNPVVCNSYISPSGRYVWISSGIYSDTLQNSQGFDSIITVSLTILNSTFDTINPTACNSFLSPSGKYQWMLTGTYIDTIPNHAGCDSIITVNLTIETVDTRVFQTDTSLLSLAEDASYQWLDCNRNYAPIEYDTNRYFLLFSSGTFAVEISQNSCIDTSQCYPVLVEGIKDNQLCNLKIFPNPTRGLVHIDTEAILQNTVTLYDQLHQRYTIRVFDQYEIDLSELKSGIYIIEIRDKNNNRIHRKILKI